MFSGTFV